MKPILLILLLLGVYSQVNASGTTRDKCFSDWREQKVICDKRENANVVDCENFFCSSEGNCPEAKSCLDMSSILRRSCFEQTNLTLEQCLEEKH